MFVSINRDGMGISAPSVLYTYVHPQSLSIHSLLPSSLLSFFFLPLPPCLKVLDWTPQEKRAA